MSTLPYRAASLRATLVDNPKLRLFAVVNALWEFSFAGLKSFIVLYIVRGLGRSPAVASAVIAVVAVAYIVGAPLASWIADRYGLLRVLELTSFVYGAGLLAGAVAHTLAPLLIVLGPIAVEPPSAPHSPCSARRGATPPCGWSSAYRYSSPPSSSAGSSATENCSRHRHTRLIDTHDGDAARTATKASLPRQAT